MLVARGREVVVVGDFNVCHKEIDHCEPGKCILNGVDKFEDTPSRRWMESFVVPQGNMVDLFRHFHPDRRGAFTCWNTLIDARKSNYGTRIDYIMCTPNMVSWFETCDIDTSIMGSDHCPVFAVLRDKHPQTGESLHEALGHTEGIFREPPKLCTKFWKEFSGTQTTLSRWMSSGRDSAPALSLESSSALKISEPPLKKPKLASKPKQRDIKSFFAQQPPSQGPMAENNLQPPLTIASDKDDTDVKRLPSMLDSRKKGDNSTNTETTKVAAAAWKSLLVPPSIPRCHHDEPAKEFRVNKPGPNNGRFFYLCARPVGPSDGKNVDGTQAGDGMVRAKGRQKLTEFRCDFFVWKKGGTKKKPE
ncbi:Class II abasic (AP) endonuclease [Dinochytrium kinnereticum]|nr:Class II abasic (AP) endonuclease [Dinochytrium kinnereticum]